MSSTPDKLSQAGDVHIDEVSIITSKGLSVNVTPQVTSIEIFEDIFGAWITGRVLLTESQDLTGLLPLVGEEIVKFTVQTPSLPEQFAYKGEFYIYKMDGKSQVAERQQMYALYFISKEAIIDLNVKISKGYEGKISDIVKKVLSDKDGLVSKKQLNIEETINQTKYVSNFWSPLKNIQWLCESAISMAKSPTYIFFENKFGLNFISLDSMYTNAPLHQRFIGDNYSAEVSPLGSSSRNIEKDYQRILELDTTFHYDYIDRLKSGFYGSEIIYFDILTKQYVHKAFAPSFGESKHLNEFALYTENVAARPKATLYYDHKYYNNFEGYGDVTNTTSIQQRRCMLAQAEGHKITITVFGRTDYSAGQKVYVDVPRKTQIKEKDEDPQDKIISGNYIIAACCHRITRKSHECVLELIKDSYMVNINAAK